MGDTTPPPQEDPLAALRRQVADDPTTVEEVVRLLEDEDREHARNARVASMVGSIRKVAANRMFTVITDPRSGPGLDDRHNAPEVNICNRLISCLFDNSRGPHERRRELEELHEHIYRFGGFFEQYHGTSAERLNDSLFTRDASGALTLRSDTTGGWVIGLASGHTIDEANDYLPTAAPVTGGDGHFYVPEDVDNPTIQVPLPNQFGDTISEESRDIYEEIVRNPACALWIADISAELREQGFASVAEDTMFKMALDINERQQRKHPLKYAVAAIAQVAALEDEAGNVIHKFDPVMFNRVSYTLHTNRRSRDYVGKELGVQRGRKLPVELPGGKKGNLIINWYITAQRLQQRSTVAELQLPLSPEGRVQGLPPATNEVLEEEEGK